MDNLYRIERDRSKHTAPIATDQVHTSPPPATPLILVVDNEQHICNIVEEYFTILGYRVIKAMSGETGIRRFMDNNPAIVITDLHISDCTGFDIARKVKELSPGTVIILITGQPIESLDMGDSAGYFDYTLQKPVDFAMLAGIVESVVRHGCG